MAPDTFHPYPGLPDELKVQIWKHAIGPPAAHHFKLNLPDDFSDLMVMTIEPIAGPAKDDPSIWRDTWSYSAADTVSHQLLAPENQLMVWQRDKSKQERIDKAVQKKGGGGLRYGSKALINASRDLVHFKFTGDEFDPWSLSRLDNRKLLKGIKRVAFDWKPTQHCRKGHWIIRPFECMCNIPGPHMWQENCHRSIAKFLSLFADLETFYFIIEVRRVEIDETWLAKQVKKPEPRGTKRARNGKAKLEACQNFPARLKEIRGKPAPELIEETIAVFRGTNFLTGVLPFHSNALYHITHTHLPHIIHLH